MSTFADHLKSLHTTVVDAKNGYEEALHDAEGRGLTPLFMEMIGLHHAHSKQLAARLVALGETPNDKGSFLSTIHRTVISIRSLFGELDERILPGLIDGEKRVVSYYDQALEDTKFEAEDAKLLNTQRDAVKRKIAEMSTLKLRAAQPG
jgi:uncharacterized protein (TIGR02284 family)